MPVCGLKLFHFHTETTFETWHQRIYLYKNMGFTQILILMQVCRLWNLPLSNHCTPDCTKLFCVSNKTLYLFSTIREGTCTWPGWLAMVPPWEPCFWRMAPWLVNQGTFDHGPMADHGQPWYIWPWSTMVLLTMPPSTMVGPWLTMLFEKWHHGHGDHGWQWSSQFLTVVPFLKARSTMVGPWSNPMIWPWSNHFF